MFSDSPIESTGFTGIPDTERNESDASIQTTAVSTSARETQTVGKYDTSNQTDFLLSLENPPQYDSVKLSSFLDRIYPELLLELNKNDKCNTPCKYNNVEGDVTGKIIHEIDSKRSQGKAVSSLSWNCTGMSLAISFCETEHQSWCSHDSQIHVYSTGKKNFEASPPAYVLDTNSCVKCVLFHPSEPMTVVAGQYNGQVLVWDLENDELIKPDNKGLGDYSIGHSDGITSMTWIEELPAPVLATAGKDGKVIIWKQAIVTKSLQILEKYFIPSSHYNAKNHLTTDYAEIGSISVWQKATSDFVIAAGGSNILHCSRKTSQIIATVPGFSDPVTMRYEPHSGMITGLSCAANPLFATSGTDSQIRIYKLRERSPIHVIHTDMPLLGVAWADDAAGVVSCWGSSPDVHFYKIATKEKLDSHSIKLKFRDSQITAAKINKLRKCVTAVGTQCGEISIWTVPQLSEST